jgi:hypothetical protein
MAPKIIGPAENDEMTKDAAASSCESELKELELAWKLVSRNLREAVYGAIKGSQACSNNLYSQRTGS